MSRYRWVSHMVLILRSAHPGFLTPRGVNSCALAPRVSVRWADEQPRVLSGCRGRDHGHVQLAARCWRDHPGMGDDLPGRPGRLESRF